jgi:hypothetical protein
MPASEDTNLHFEFNDHQPHHGLSLKDNDEYALRQPVRFTSKTVLAELPATPVNEAWGTPEAIETSSYDLSIETSVPNRTHVFNNHSVTAKAKATGVKILKQTDRHGAQLVTPAHTLKRKLSSITPTGTANRGMAEHDPANRSIKRLREEKGLKWGQIADILNKQLIAQGKRPSFTNNGVYSRYTRNAPRIAAMEAWPTGKVGSPDLHTCRCIHTLTRYLQDEMLVRAYHEVQAEMLEELWHRVSDKIVEAGGERIAPDVCAFRYNNL